jgi:hypothetical protein
MYQMVSPIRGHLAQMNGTLTKERYNVTIIFVDNYSDFIYFNLQKSTKEDETIKAKEVFERLDESHTV